MKKSIALIISIIMLVFTLALTACSDGSGYVVKFKVNNEVYYSVKTAGNTQIQMPENPSMQGYEFYGWYLDKDYTQPFNKDYFKNKALEGDVDVYARFVVSECTATFMINGEIYDIVQITKREQIVMPNTPNIDGYEFAGWYLDETFTEPFDRRYFIENLDKSTVTVYAEMYKIIVFEDEYRFNDTHHWIQEVDGETKKNYDTHTDIGGKCEVCDYYYDATDVLSFKFIEYNGIEGYEVSAYDKEGGINHVEVPAYYNGYPVVSIGENAFSSSPLESIKLNEGLIYIERAAFSSTMIEEFVMPSTVVGMKPTSWPVYENGTYNTFGGCVALKRAVLSDNIKIVGGYTFSSCANLEEVVLGKNTEQILVRAFYECKSLEKIVIPEKVNYIPEGEISSAAASGKVVSLHVQFAYADEIFLEITKEEYEALVVPLYDRSLSTGERIPDDIVRNPGFCSGWEGMADLYFKGEWYYDENGRPNPNN